MDKDINKNLTPEQAQGIEKQDVTKGVVDVDILEQAPEKLPEQPTTNAISSPTLSAAETLAQTNEQQRVERIESERRAEDLANQQVEQESLVKALGQETLGRGEAETQAFEKAGIGSAQSEVDTLNKSILSATNTLKQARVQDELDIKQVSFSSRGVPASIVNGKQAQLRAQRNAERNIQAIELENMIATSELLQGNVDSAKQAIQRSIGLKFEDKKAELSLEKEFLSRIDSKEARAKSEAVARKEKEIAKQEAEAQSVFDISAQARQAGAGQREINAILNAETREEAIAAAGSLGRIARIDAAIKSAQLNSLRAASAEKGKLQLTNGKVVDEEAYTRAKSLLGVANSIKNHPAKKRATGKSSIVNIATLPGTERKDFLNLTNQLLADLTLENTGRLKGAISEKELAIAQSAASSLDANSTEKEFDRQLDIIINTFSDNIGQPPPLTVTEGGIQIPSSNVSNEEYFK